MNKVIAVLSFVAVVGGAHPDVSWADKHVLAPPGGEGRSLMPAERDDFIGPALRVEGLSQRAEPPPWNCVSLTHTDPHHLFGNEPHHPAPYRNFQMPDGAALIFSWPFAALSPFRASTPAAPRETKLHLEDGGTDPYPK